MKSSNILDKEYVTSCIQEYEAIRVRRKAYGKPDQYARVELILDKMFESFYKTVLTYAEGRR